MIFLVLSGKMIFLYPENMILLLRRKMKHDLSQKFTEIWYFLQIAWKYGIFQRDRAGIWSFLYYLERWCFFPRNMTFFHWEGSGGRSFSRNTWKYEIFCEHVQVLQTWRPAPLPKIVKGYLEKAPAVPFHFMETFIGVFIYCSPAKKKPRKLNM